MIIVDTALRRREEEGRPVRVAMIGAGFMGAGVALQIETAVPGMRLVGIAARTPHRGVEAFKDAGCDDAVTCETASEIADALRAGKAVVTEDHVALAQADDVDVVLEVTGSMDYALEAVLAAIDAGKHVCLMNAELDGTVGPYLKLKADAAGVVFTNVDGDQPGVAMNLYRFVKGLGVKPVLCGNIKGLHDAYRNPETQKAFAEKWGQNVRMVTSFADGTKIAYEQAITANGTGMRVAKRGMVGPDLSGGDPYAPLKDIQEFIPHLEPHIDPEGPGIVDYVVGARPGPGVFVLGAQNHPRQQHYLSYYKLGPGPYYVFYTPYHLCHLEAPTTLARAVLFQDAALTPDGAPKVGVIARAKRDLVAGQTLDDIGGFDMYAEAENAEAVAREGLLPMGIAIGCKLKSAVAKDAYLTFADVEPPAGRLIDKLYAEQADAFGLSPAPA